MRESGPGFESYFKLCCPAFGFGFGWHAIVSEAAQWAGAFKAKRGAVLTDKKE